MAEDAAQVLLSTLQSKSSESGLQGALHALGDLLHDRDGLASCSPRTQGSLLRETLTLAEEGSSLAAASFAWTLISRFPEAALRDGSTDVMGAVGRALGPAVEGRGNFRLPRTGWSSNSVLEGASQVLRVITVGVPGESMGVQCLQHVRLWMLPACRALLRGTSEVTHDSLCACLDVIAQKWRARDPAAILEHGGKVSDFEALEADLAREFDSSFVPRLAQMFSSHNTADILAAARSWGVYAALLGKNLPKMDVKIVNKFLKSLQGALQLKEDASVREASLRAWARLIDALDPRTLNIKWASVLVCPFLSGYLPALSDPDLSVFKTAGAVWSSLLQAVTPELLARAMPADSEKPSPTIWDTVVLRCLKKVVEGKDGPCNLSVSLERNTARTENVQKGFVQIAAVFDRGLRSIQQNGECSDGAPSASNVSGGEMLSNKQVRWLLKSVPGVLAIMQEVLGSSWYGEGCEREAKRDISRLWLALVKLVGEMASLEPPCQPSDEVLQATSGIFKVQTSMCEKIATPSCAALQVTFGDLYFDFQAALTQFPVFSNPQFISAYMLSDSANAEYRLSGHWPDMAKSYPLIRNAMMFVQRNRQYPDGKTSSVTENILEDVILALNSPDEGHQASLQMIELATACASTNERHRKEFCLRQNELGMETGDLDLFAWNLCTKVVEARVLCMADDGLATQTEMGADIQVALCAALNKMLLVPLELLYYDGRCLAEAWNEGRDAPSSSFRAVSERKFKTRTSNTVIGVKALGAWKALFGSMVSMVSLHSGRYLPSISFLLTYLSSIDLVRPAWVSGNSPAQEMNGMMPNCVCTELLVNVCSTILSKIPAVELNDCAQEGRPDIAQDDKDLQSGLAAVLKFLQNVLFWVHSYSEFDSAASKRHAAVLLQSLEMTCKRISRADPALAVLEFSANSLARFMAEPKHEPHNLHSLWNTMMQMCLKTKMQVNESVLRLLGPPLVSAFSSSNLVTVNRTVVFWNAIIAPALEDKSVTYPTCLYGTLSNMHLKGNINLPDWHEIEPLIKDSGTHRPQGTPGGLPAKISDIFSPGKGATAASKETVHAQLKRPTGAPAGLAAPASPLPSEEGRAATKRAADELPADVAGLEKVRKRAGTHSGGAVSCSLAPSFADGRDLKAAQEGYKKKNAGPGREPAVALDALRDLDWGDLPLSDLVGAQAALLRAASGVCLAIQAKTRQE